MSEREKCPLCGANHVGGPAIMDLDSWECGTTRGMMGQIKQTEDCLKRSVPPTPADPAAVVMPEPDLLGEYGFPDLSRVARAPDRSRAWVALDRQSDPLIDRGRMVYFPNALAAAQALASIGQGPAVSGEACVWCGYTEDEHGTAGESVMGRPKDRLCPIPGVTGQFYTKMPAATQPDARLTELLAAARWMDRPTGPGLWTVALFQFERMPELVTKYETWLVGENVELFNRDNAPALFKQEGWKQVWYGPVPAPPDSSSTETI